MVTINDLESLKERIESTDKSIVLVKVSAAWCGPCRVLADILSKLEKDELSDVEIVDVDADEAEEICQEYGVRNIPTMIFIKDGNVVDKTFGLVVKDDLVSKIDNIRNA